MNRDPYNTIIRPLLTEKITATQEESGKFFFEVRKDANKVEIRKAIESLFSVRVRKVNTMIVHGEQKRRGQHYYKKKSYKKAVVTLFEGDTIELFEGV